jgi:nitrite reductase (NADH) small subunit
MRRKDSMMETTLALISAIPPGEGRTFQVGPRRLAVFHARGRQVFATQAECPHRGGPLADGLLGGSVLICPLHGWKFDMRTGERLASAGLPACKLETYCARVDAAGRILVRLGAGDAEEHEVEPAA